MLLQVVGSLGTISIDSFDKSNETDLLAVEMTGVLSLDELELDFLPIEGGLGNKTGKLQIVSSLATATRRGKTDLHRLVTDDDRALGLV
jgi:hypothetical protein